jgi:hypothetical protein
VVIGGITSSTALSLAVLPVLLGLLVTRRAARATEGERARIAPEAEARAE